jgi:serpin B
MKLITVGLVVLLVSALGALRATADPAPREAAAVVRGDNQFALELYGRLRGQQGNLFFSPYSISTALAMTYGGARGQTAEQMAATLHFTLPPERLHPAMVTLIRAVNGAGKQRGCQLRTANALWGQKGHPFRPEFLALTQDNYGAGLREVDFAGAAEPARRTINAWVEKETGDKIKDLIRPGVLAGDTRLVLTNAIYFKGDWASQFKKDRTREEPFHVSADKTVPMPLMHQGGRFKHFDGGNFQALELPYAGKDLAMVVLLPRKVYGLADFEKTLTADNLAGWLDKLREHEVEVALPRFRMTGEFLLNKTLFEMGMPSAFTRAADFSGMDGRKDLFLSKVIHKAFVDVNEAGTEAAAATAVVGEEQAERVKSVFRADHPFAFLIRDTRSGSILFLGRLTNLR